MLSRTGGQLLGKRRQAVGGLAGVRSLREALFETPGSWLYRPATLAWLSDPTLVRQLPRPYRFFASYCAAQRQPIGAEMLLRGIIALRRRTLASEGIVPLRVGEVTVFLDLHDPRFLRVPSELTEQQRLLRHFLRPGDTFIDVGANHGTFSIVASALVGRGGLVVAIEPQPRLAALLRRSLACGPARFEVHPIACGDRSQDVELYIPLATSGSAGVFRRHSAIALHRTVTVPMRPLDDVIDWRGLPGQAFIKLDVEGSELAFLLGAGELIRAKAPAMLIEINPAAMSAAGTSTGMLVQALMDLGYDRFATPAEPRRERPLDRTIDSEHGDVILLPAAPDR